MAKLTAKTRKALPKSQFAVKTPKGEPDKYPIHDKAHARNALSRVAQHGTSAEKAKVKAAVKKKYPDVGKSSGKKR
jgi:hypothetical protein